MKFKVGDVIVGNEESNKTYSFTNKENGFIGVVVEPSIGVKFAVKQIEGAREGHGRIWTSLKEELFDLKEGELRNSERF